MRTIFKKQLFLYLGTLVLSFVFLGAALSQGIRVYFVQQRVQSLTASAERIAHSMTNMIAYGVLSLPELHHEINILHQYLDAKVMIIDTEYNVLWESGHAADRTAPAYAPELEAMKNRQTVIITGSMNQVFNEPYLTVGYPFLWNDQPQGGVLVSASMAELEAAIFGLYRITLIYLCVVALFAGVLIYFTGRAISRPLRQINQAACVIAEGDFDKRIPVLSKDEVGQLAEQFNAMAESLSQQEKIRRTFIANLSHDLRSPLTSMRGFLKALQDGTVPADKQAYYINIVLEESERLIKLSNDILDIHRVQESALALNRAYFDINGLIRATVMHFEKQATDKRLLIDCRFAHAADRVYADEAMVKRVVYNLLDNAVKFAPADQGLIVIETTVSDTHVTVSVSDNGCGMTDEEQKHIFDRFYKGDPSRGQDRMGSGLGLSIVREFVKAHGGQVTVQSEAGKGSVFTFELGV